jgi:small conductance mechanosensitive channel
MEFSTDSIMGIITFYSMRIVTAFIMVAVGFMVASWASRFARAGLMKINNVDITLARFFSSLLKYAILAFTGVAVLGHLGVETASLIAVFGAAGLAIGLALQGTLGHVASGVMLLIFRPFKVGDFIEVGGQSGSVQEISLFTTTLSTPDNVKLIIPNGQVWDQALKNFSAYDTRRMQLNVGIAYNADIGKAMEVINKTIAADKRALQEPAPAVLVQALGASSVDLIVRVWAKQSDFWPLNFDLTRAIKEALDEAGIEIPFPQRVLHIQNPQALAQPAAKKSA